MRFRRSFRAEILSLVVPISSMLMPDSASSSSSSSSPPPSSSFADSLSSALDPDPSPLPCDPWLFLLFPLAIPEPADFRVLWDVPDAADFALEEELPLLMRDPAETLALTSKLFMALCATVGSSSPYILSKSKKAVRESLRHTDPDLAALADEIWRSPKKNDMLPTDWRGRLTAETTSPAGLSSTSSTVPETTKYISRQASAVR
mmetsp:Transcript_27684/g.64406  ORF Transcript_27684/g.64406 Transcript_27684/m.64406 type:complete len:204 (-) Transcript_27684:759-1370(-)